VPVCVVASFSDGDGVGRQRSVESTRRGAEEAAGIKSRAASSRERRAAEEEG